MLLHPSLLPFRPFAAFLLFLSFQTAFAQKISGRLLDASGVGQEFATITLLSARDSSLTKGAVSDEQGLFEIENVPAGRYFVRTQLLGFQPAQSDVFEYNRADLALPPLVLKPSGNQLQEITVVAQKPLIEVNADKLVFNVDASPTNTGLNALELLRKSPGVSLDQDENVSLKGRSNVMVQINGKPTPMTGQDLAQYLKSINSADVEAIEIIATPGAKYEAEGNAGIINLRLKKDKRMGTNGTVSLGFYQGITPKGDAAISINHRDRKINLFGSASVFRGRWDNPMQATNIVGSRLYNLRTNNYRYARPQWGRFGVDYAPNSRHTFGALFNGGVFFPDLWSKSRTEIGSLSQNSVDSLLIAENDGGILNWNANVNLNYKFADQKGNQLNIDADYGMFRDSQTIFNNNYYRDPENVQTLATSAFRTDMPRDITIQSVKTDYEKTLSLFGKEKNTHLGAGGKYSDVDTDNTFNFFKVSNNAENLDPDRSNTFVYNERIVAAYVNGNTQVGKFSVQVGLRMENTDVDGDLFAYKPVDDKTVDTTYTSFFPSAALGYNVSKNHQINLTYRRSVDRPRYQDLNPFELRLDELSYRRGNPFIRPQFTHTLELGWSLFQRVHLSANYARTLNAFTNIADQEIDPLSGKQRFYIQVRNLATRDNWGFNINTPIPIAKWWNGNLNAFYNYSINKADYGAGRIIDLRVSGGGFWTQQTFTLSKTLTAEASGWYNWGGLWGAYVQRPQGMMDVGISKRLWDGAGTLRVSFTDVFHTAGWSSYTQVGELYVNAKGAWEGQQFKINMTYRFGNNNLQSIRRRSTGADDESKRASGGE